MCDTKGSCKKHIDLIWSPELFGALSLINSRQDLVHELLLMPLCVSLKSMYDAASHTLVLMTRLSQKPTNYVNR